MEEIWKPIKGYESIYEVSSLGRVRSLNRGIARRNKKDGSQEVVNIKGKIIKQKISKWGYLEIGLNNNKSSKGAVIHRLVAEAFINNTERKPQVNHIDGNKKNNNVQNLEWCTPKENAIHAYSIGLRRPRYCENAPCSKLTNEHAASIMLDNRDTKTIAKEYGLSYSGVYMIKTGRSYKRIFNQLLECAVLFLRYRKGNP